MRLPLSVAYACLLALAVFPVPAAAETLTQSYGRALRAFNDRLPSERCDRYAAAVIAEADRAGIDARLVVALVAVESRWHPEAVSPAGAIGLGQLMPGTAGGLGVDPRDPTANVHGTVVHLAGLLRGYRKYGTPNAYYLALGAYNAGAGAVARYGGVPPYAETRKYVYSVIKLWRRLAGSDPS